MTYRYLVLLNLLLFMSMSVTANEDKKTTASRNLAEKKSKNKNFKLSKYPKSLFLIKNKDIENSFGEPTINLPDRQQRLISEDKRL